MIIRNTVPRLGDRKIRKRFAWLVTRIDDRTRIWLQRYEEVWVYQKVIRTLRSGSCIGPSYETTDWELKEKRL